MKLANKAHGLNATSSGGWYHSTLFYDFYRKGMYNNKEALEILNDHPGQRHIETQQKYVAIYGELRDLKRAREHWEKCRQLDPNWSADKLAQMSELWNFDMPVRMRYLQSVAKAGYSVTGQSSNSEWK